MDENFENLPALPNGWIWSTAESICKSVRDGTHDTPKYHLDGIPLITSKNLSEKGLDFSNIKKISLEDHHSISKRSKVENGDILFAMIGTIGYPVVVNSEITFSIKNVGLFKKNDSFLHPLYLKYWLENKILFAILESFHFIKGTTQKFIPLGALRTIPVPLSPFKEQHRIVSKLEELFTKLDVSVAELKKAKAQIKRYRQSVLKSAFEGKLTNDNVKEGELPEGWNRKSIKGITSILGDGLHGTPHYSDDGEFYFINGNNLSDGIIEIKTNTKRVTKEEFERYKKTLNDRTIFVSINGTLGNTAFYNGEKVILGKSACYFNLIESVDKHFIRYCITTQRFMNYANDTATGSTIKNVSLKSMREFEIPLPPTIEEQQAIVSEIERHFSVADATEKIIDQSLKQAERLRQSILKDAFTGKLVPQDPNDEPAAKLLDRIKAEREKQQVKVSHSRGKRT